MIHHTKPASRNRFALFLSLCTALIDLSCNQPFDPRGPLDSKLVVFSILSTDRSTQFVRVERTYMPAGFDPYAHTQDNFVSGAVVRIQGPGLSSTFQDTTLPRSDRSRYPFPLRAYFTRPLVAEYGGTYSFTINSPGYREVSASIKVPARPTVTMTPLTRLILPNPQVYEDSAEIVFTTDLGIGSKGWIGRLYVCYDVLKDGKWLSDRTEVPFYYTNPLPFTGSKYGTLTRGGYQNRCGSIYLNILYRRTCVEVIEQLYPRMEIVFRKAVFEVVQVENNLYDYYQLVHAYNDPFSVRLDVPFFTNLMGGVGVAGAYTLDSLVQAMPPDFVFNR